VHIPVYHVRNASVPGWLMADLLKYAVLMLLFCRLTLGQLLRWIFATPVQFISAGGGFTWGPSMPTSEIPNMDVLVAMGTNAAYFSPVSLCGHGSAYARNGRGSEGVYGLFRDERFTDFVYSSGKVPGGGYKGEDEDAIQKLLNLTPDTATLLTFDRVGGSQWGEWEIDSRLIQRGDVIRVLPGARYPQTGQ